jgi:predicted transcriptional regulator of viral defense system
MKVSNNIYPSENELKNRFLTELLHRISTSSDDYPTTRCWEARHLGKFLTHLRTELVKLGKLPQTFARTRDILSWLRSMGLLCELPVTGGVSSKTSLVFHILEVGAGADSAVSPFELLQAFQPKGVISFFSALSFHGLTTQTPPFHHIATLVARTATRAPDAALADTTPCAQDVAKHSFRDNLGSYAFSFAHIPYYSKRRYADLVAGIQLHMVDKRIQLRVTDIEQSILDTLAHPDAAGGAAVIFEAWEQGWSKVRPARLAQYLRPASMPLARRFGAMCGFLDLTPAPEIQDALAAARRKRDATQTQPIDLFRGVPGQKLDSDWNVKIPL